MSLKRSRTSTSAEPGFDRTRFVSAAAEQRYDRGMRSKVAIMEKGFEINPRIFPEIDRIITIRHWKKLCQQPCPACISIVREFYANAPEHHAYEVMVRGKQVTFDATSINRFYRIPKMEADKYSAIRNEIDITHLTETLCIPNATWEMSSSGEYMKMSSKSLKPEARVWFYFLTRSLLPGTHISFVTKERMILLYCLLEGFSINVGELIATNIVWATNSTQAGLYYCHLITSLCTLVMVPVDPIEEMMRPMTALTARIIQQLRTERQAHAGSSSSAPARQPQQPPQPPQRSSWPRTISQEVRRLGSCVDYIIQYNRAMCQAIQQMVHNLHIDIPEFPDPP